MFVAGGRAVHEFGSSVLILTRPIAFPKKIIPTARLGEQCKTGLKTPSGDLNSNKRCSGSIFETPV